MIQIFFIGSSHIYGVGAEDGGFAQQIKAEIHKKMYRQGGVGEKYEVFNFGKSGATIDFDYDNFPKFLEMFGREGGKIITVANIGGNDAKAEGTSDNYISTEAEFESNVTRLLDLLKSKSDKVLIVSSGYYDESKTNPKISPFTGGKSFFKNSRSQDFKKIAQKLCAEKNIPFVDHGVTEEEWIKKYVYADGLHANTEGHKLIAEKLMLSLEKYL